ncbi:WAT1-related protein At3g28050-like [Primulina huaijiensis]|uniref:WAT1-related protein At3g28050-like n=1 Tax=Primulina huaijiensis TaxID=1492673 RepID=UPI003CC717CE
MHEAVQSCAPQRQPNSAMQSRRRAACGGMSRQFLLPFVGMVVAMTALSTNLTVSKMAMSKGVSFYILSVYSNGLATLVLLPTAFIFRRSKFPPVTFAVVWRIFLLALCGCLADLGSYAGINYSSPILGSELLNLVPGFAYILAIIFRMETLNLKRSSGILKFLGTIILIAGASIVTLYKGAAILNKPSRFTSSVHVLALPQNWVLGGSLLAMAAFLTAVWSIVQTTILKIYPVEMIIVAIYCVFLTIQSSVIALIAEKDLTAWKLQAEMGLVAVLYAGLVNISFRIYVMSWCLSRTGPLFVTMFNPLVIVISMITGVIFFNEVLYVGSVVGSVVLVIGLYAVVWGKEKENSVREDIEGSNGPSFQVPLLQDRIEDA